MEKVQQLVGPLTTFFGVKFMKTLKVMRTRKLSHAHDITH
eukprot:COSAG06_NODE_57357_length_280_cov_1.198895_1_plen_39_part_10